MLQMSGTEGYAEEAEALLVQYESITFADVHRPVLHLIPEAPCDALDIGAGTGRDAAALAAMGHRVTAVEPVASLREGAMALHAGAAVEWREDSLPELAGLTARGIAFDLILLSAVWMHLDAAERRRAMPNLASILRPGGVVILSLRHGPVPQGRRMFAVPAEETIALAGAEGLDTVLTLRTASILPGKIDVDWTRLAFVKRRAGA